MRRQLSHLQAAILDHPGGVLAATAVLVVGALLLGTGVEFRTSRAELGPADDPDQRRWNAFLDDYAGAEALIACVESRSPSHASDPDTRRFVDRLAGIFENDPLVEHVFHRVDLDWFMRRGLFLAPAESLREAVEALTRESRMVERLAAIRGFADANALLAERIERGLAEGSPERPADDEPGARGAAALRSFVEAQRQFLESPRQTVGEWTANPAPLLLASSDPRARTDGYLKTRDGRTWFLVISRRSPDDGLAAYRELLASMKARVAEASGEQPGFRVVFTGQPAIVVEEMDTVRADTWRTSFLAVIGVGMLTFLVFRWRSHAVLVLLALASGIAWSFGAVRLELGYLNLITSSFLSTLVGVGVAYGIHPVSEYELEGAHTGDPRETVRQAFHRTGAAVTTAAVTTAAAFFSILLMRFPGFAELGLVAGVGVLLCLLAALVTLPALLTVYGRWRHQRDRVRREGAMSSAVDRFWIERVAGRICRAPALVVGLAVFVTGVMAWLATGIGFNTNFFDLLPRNAESLRYQRVMAAGSDLSPLFNLVAARDVAELRELRERAAAEPTISRFESLLQFLPDDPEESVRAVALLRDAIGGLRIAGSPAAIDAGLLAESLDRLEFALADASDAAFGAGLAETAAAMEEARAEAERARELANAATPADVAAWDVGQERVFAWLDDGLRWLREATEVGPPTVESLPYELRERFLTRSGKPLAFLYPAGDIFDPDDLAAFAAASRRVSTQTTGFPMVFSKSSRRIVDGFNVAVLVGAGLVLLILYLDFRSLREAVLAIVPLAIGVVWMLGGMRICGISFNFANLVAVPLIIGVGIDNGVHVIQRLRLEGRDGMDVVLRHTGRAIVISSLTTMVGFGSLAIASHRGMSSLGTVLLLGVGACLVTSTVVLPNLLVLTGQVKR